MEADEQKKQTKDFTFLSGYKLDVGNVLFATRLRSFIQDALKHHGQFLGYRYHILLYIRLILAALLFIIQDFKV
jgi:hypothetical protein